ncbi:uncharacterized protein LOC113514148 [Galleria mellonella]|uniref:Uncharacterized protein LOC113514148 n=1 Tax=Galleria mellonella TaxID=7137 RepID=A0A6J3C4U6_GALME|nr:uncharacterized protein LOC113514148 [Galleria mellonella]XP_052748586.1 uncharacterized protein LOC113514148 [Galleria mellonella]
MARRKSVCTKWTLVLIVAFCSFVYSRPQEVLSQSPNVHSPITSVETNKSTENPIRNSSVPNETEPPKTETSTPVSLDKNSARDVKTKGPAIGESIKLVANQLLDKPSNKTGDEPMLSDNRTPSKLKSQVIHKQKIKTRNEDAEESIENGHAGIAVPVTMEDLETENKISESSTSNEGISTWILLSNHNSKDNLTSSTEPSKLEENIKKQKPSNTKNKNKQRPQNNKLSVKRPIIGSTNKSDLVAGGSAINENVYNKIKDTVLSNVEKNRNPSTQRTPIVSTTTVPTTTEITTIKKESVTKSPTTISPVVKITSKPNKKKNKNKQKVSTTLSPIDHESALLPMEPKEQEIELEISTPATTTKKPKRSSNRKKNKTKKKKPSPSKIESDTKVSETKTNKTKSAKPAKKPNKDGPLTTQLYNYLSREVMPSVGVGVIGLASLVGLASYFFYPFSTPVRRTFEVDKKDDLYKNNDEEYASEGNGQAEEEMLGTVLAGMPSHSKQKLNPYAAQTVHNNRYAMKKEQDIRYRHVAANYEPNYNVRYPQQKTGIAHGAAYPKPINYNPNPHQYETRNVYTTENKYVYDKPSTSYPAVEPVYASSQSASSGGYPYGSEMSNSVVYGIKPNDDTDFRPVYPYEGQHMTYPSTSMELDSNSNTADSDQNKYTENDNNDSGIIDNKFVVGNVPKELVDSVDSATPAVVPEHGPRGLRRRRRHTAYSRSSITGSIEQLLKEAKNSHKDIFISNEIYDNYNYLNKLEELSDPQPTDNTVTTQPDSKDVFTVFAVTADSTKEEKTTDTPTTVKSEIVESVSTVPIGSKPEKSTTESDVSNELDSTTKNFRVYEVYSHLTDVTEKSIPTPKSETPFETTTQFRNIMTETTTDLKSETTSTMPPSPSPVTESTTEKCKDTPELVTYPPPSQQGGFLSLLKRFIEFKYKLGLSILQTTSDNLKRYLETSAGTGAKPHK